MITPLPREGEQNPAYDLLSQSRCQYAGGTPPTLRVASSVPHWDLKGQPRNSVRQSSGRLIEASKREPCPICGRTRGFCKWNPSSEIKLCSQITSGFKKGDVIRGDDGGQWAFTGLDRGSQQWAAFVPHREREARITTVQRPVVSTPSVTAISVANRDLAFKILHNQLALHVDDEADFLRRGLSHEQIRTIAPRTLKKAHRFKAPIGLPGFRHGRFTGETGYWIPTRDWEGRITGGQVRLREGGYRWLLACHLPSGELPLQIIKGDPSKPVYWIESTMVKPWIVHLLTGATVIGAAGGNFGGCASQVREVLARTQGQRHVLLPDAGAIYNRNILNQHDRLFELIPDIHICWWGQFHYGSNDADENPAWVDGTRLP